jgi:hypothetical protein
MSPARPCPAFVKTVVKTSGHDRPVPGTPHANKTGGCEMRLRRGNVRGKPEYGAMQAGRHFRCGASRLCSPFPGSTVRAARRGHGS